MRGAKKTRCTLFQKWKVVAISKRKIIDKPDRINPDNIFQF